MPVTSSGVVLPPLASLWFQTSAADGRSGMVGGEHDDVNLFGRKLHGGEFRDSKHPETGQFIQRRVWTRTGVLNGVKHHRGKPMRTWQVLQELGLYSYRLDHNPEYRASTQTFAPKVAPTSQRRISNRELAKPAAPRWIASTSNGETKEAPAVKALSLSAASGSEVESPTSARLSRRTTSHHSSSSRGASRRASRRSSRHASRRASRRARSRSDVDVEDDVEVLNV